MPNSSSIGNWNDQSALAEAGGYRLVRGHVEVGLSVVAHDRGQLERYGELLGGGIAARWLHG